MIKKIILFLMVFTVFIIFINTIVFAIKNITIDVKHNISCEGRIQMTCGEGGCEDLCYPSVIKI